MVLVHRAHFTSKATGSMLILSYRQSQSFLLLAIHSVLTALQLQPFYFAEPVRFSPQIPYLAKTFLPFQSQLKYNFHLEHCPDLSGRFGYLFCCAFLTFFYYGTNTSHRRFLLVYFLIQSFPSITHSARYMGETPENIC